MQPDHSYDVVIAGAGPVGLFLACELRLAGVSVLVLERLADPHTPLKSRFMGARGLNVPSTEAFYRRGLLPDLRASALGWMDPAAPQPGIQMSNEPAKDAPQAPRFAGHFAGIMLDANKIDLSDQPYIVAGPSAAGGLVSLEGVEDVLTARAVELGVEIRYGTPLTGFTQDEQRVTIHAGNETFRAAWLAGCDGGRSTVRKLAGFEFPGTDPEVIGYIGLVEIADPEKLLPGFNLTPNGMYVNGPAPGRISVVEFKEAPEDRDMPVTLEMMQASLRRVSGTDVTLTALHIASRYSDNARQVPNYRKGRVILAGDAAHVHSPFGGQGMNLGLGDAMNLGWKLAAAVHGWAPADLLDTYTSERHPIGAWALDWTRAQVAIMRPDPHGRAIASVVRDLIQTRDGTNYFIRKVAGLWLHYDIPGDHPVIGRTAPDLLFEDDSRLGDLLHEGKGLLLDLEEDSELHTIAGRWTGRIKYVAARSEERFNLTALLIRPDGFVAWATEGKPIAAQLIEAITHWFGAPETP
jgi:2-polyprenyl-6-methoxyphenol hydroxylase-like FAD-dependent oxidoreductase